MVNGDDSNGNLLWKQTYENVVPRALIQTSDGGYAIASASGELIKTDSKGNLSWKKSYPPSETLNFGGSLSQTSDGGYAIAGVRNVPGTEPSSREFPGLVGENRLTWQFTVAEHFEQFNTN